MTKFKPFLEQLQEKFSPTFPDPVQQDLNELRSPISNRFYNNRFLESPSQNRSIRQIEEQISGLKKENFNLKLRIYFLEEQIPELSKMNTPDGQQSFMKQFLDNKIETKILQIDLEDKQKLIVEAAEALTHMENLQKDTEKKYEKMIDELNHKIQYLEFEKDSLEKCLKNEENVVNDQLSDKNPPFEGNKIDMVQKVRILERCVKDAELNSVKLNNQIISLEEIVAKKDKIIVEHGQSLKQYDFEKSELIEQLELKDKNLIKTEECSPIMGTNIF